MPAKTKKPARVSTPTLKAAREWAADFNSATWTDEMKVWGLAEYLNSKGSGPYPGLPKKEWLSDYTFMEEASAREWRERISPTPKPKGKLKKDAMDMVATLRDDIKNGDLDPNAESILWMARVHGRHVGPEVEIPDEMEFVRHVLWSPQKTVKKARPNARAKAVAAGGLPPLTKWSPGSNVRGVPLFVIEQTGLKTVKQLVARFGTGAVFRKGTSAPAPRKW